jgi:hypothetical protein
VILKINVALLEGAIAFIVTLTSDIAQPRVTLAIVVFLMESPYDRKVARQTACVGMFPSAIQYLPHCRATNWLFRPSAFKTDETLTKPANDATHTTNIDRNDLSYPSKRHRSPALSERE